MNKKEYLTKITSRMRRPFYVLVLVTAYETLYWIEYSSGLSFVLVLLSGSITYFAYTLIEVFEDMMKNS